MRLKYIFFFRVIESFEESIVKRDLRNTVMRDKPFTNQFRLLSGTVTGNNPSEYGVYKASSDAYIYNIK